MLLQNNRVNLETYALIRQTHSIHLQSSAINRDIAHLARKSTQTACANQVAAQPRSQTTRVSVEVHIRLPILNVGPADVNRLCFLRHPSL
jgi:hypothetical protein